MQVGDLVQPTTRMRSFGYDSHGIVIKIKSGRFVVYFPALGLEAVFHPSHLKPDKK